MAKGLCRVQLQSLKWEKLLTCGPGQAIIRVYAGDAVTQLPAGNIRETCLPQKDTSILKPILEF